MKLWSHYLCAVPTGESREGLVMWILIMVLAIAVLAFLTITSRKKK